MRIKSACVLHSETNYLNTQKRSAICWIAGRFSLLLFIQKHVIYDTVRGNEKDVLGQFASI
ncbi:hypothetical protein THF5H11_70163 [Vibrio jasicida]|nr:hypothetical protein THF5H11_70163 [Vibrio jasicida]